METSSTTTEPAQTTVGTRALARLYSVAFFFLGVLRFVGIFIFGMFVGMGIVLKNPPEDKKTMQLYLAEKTEKEKTSVLLKQCKDENDVLIKKLKDYKPEPKPYIGTIKDGLIIKN